MNKVVNVCQPGIIATIEQFTLADEELRQFVVYTYYDKNAQPLYIGGSKDFYNAHFFNSQRFSFWDEVEYVGFVFENNEEDMKISKQYYIRAREPKYNKHKYADLDFYVGLEDEFVVYRKQMERRWREWLGSDDNIDCEECPYQKLFNENVVILVNIGELNQRKCL